MLNHSRWLILLLALVAIPSFAGAEVLRLRFVPIDANGATGQVPIGPDGALGELKRNATARPLPYAHAVPPTQIVTFRHPFTCRNVTVPLRLPAEKARMEHLPDRIAYHFTDYTVEVRFLHTGGVDVVYNSGLVRPLRFQ